MRLLFLGPEESPVLGHLRTVETEVASATEVLTEDLIEKTQPEFLVSHGYRHIIRPWVIERFPDRIVNLHIGYLPWNRGADPNFWSIVDGSPSGVTIHHVDAGVDTGDVIVQEQVPVYPDDTLRTSYDRLQS